MKTKKFPGAVAWSLVAHVLALALVVMIHANGARPRPAFENVPFIRASLIYAMNGRDEQKPSPVLRRQKERAAPVAVKPVEPPPAAGKANDQAAPEAVMVESAVTEKAEDAGTDAAVSLHLPSLKSLGAGQIASRGEAAGNHYPAGPQGGSGKTRAMQMMLPRYLNNARPPYPLMARVKGFEGTVLLSVEVMTDGRAGEVNVKKSSGYTLLDQSALNAVRVWRFEPARKMGVPLAMTVDIPVRFALNEAD